MNSLKLYTQDRKSIQRTWLGLILVLSLMLGTQSVAQAQGGAPELFSDAGAADVAPDTAAHIVRSRLVHVNLGALSGPNGDALNVSAEPEIALNLFADARFTGVITAVESNDSGGKTWTGRLKEGRGIFFIVISEGAFIAHVASQKGIYEVSMAGENLYKVVQIDQSKLGEDAPGLVDHPDPALLSENDVAADPASPIDVMVIYTDDARATAGSPAAIRAQIDLAMAETKTAYVNGGVVPRLRLVHTEEVIYAETGNLELDLNRLVNPGDGILDNVHNLRNIYGADMVAFIVENGGGFCGLAADILATAGNAFHVTKRDGCMTGYYSFAHEFGHLQGARHDLYVDPNTSPFAHGHGYVDTTHRWRTVMAYVNECLDTNPFSYCDRLPYFSNPSRTYSGHPAGETGVAENFKVLNATANTVANFKQAKIGPGFNNPFDSTVGPWRPVAGVWALGSTPAVTFYASNGIPGKYASAYVNRFFGDLTYEVRLIRAGCQSCSNSLIVRGNPGNRAPDNTWQPSYIFSFTNNGTISVWKVFPNGAVTALKGWTASAAVVKNGWNKLKVVAINNSLRYYVNNTLVYIGSDGSFRTGRVGVELYRDTTSTGNKLRVDWARLSNTPTGGVPYDEVVEIGEALEGGTPAMSP